MSNQSPLVKHIPISHYEELKQGDVLPYREIAFAHDAVFIDDMTITNEGGKTYLVTTINNTKEKE